MARPCCQEPLSWVVCLRLPISSVVSAQLHAVRTGFRLPHMIGCTSVQHCGTVCFAQRSAAALDGCSAKECFGTEDSSTMSSLGFAVGREPLFTNELSKLLLSSTSTL